MSASWLIVMSFTELLAQKLFFTLFCLYSAEPGLLLPPIGHVLSIAGCVAALPSGLHCITNCWAFPIEQTATTANAATTLVRPNKYIIPFQYSWSSQIEIVTYAHPSLKHTITSGG